MKLLNPNQDQIIPTMLDGEQQEFDEKKALPRRGPGSWEWFRLCLWRQLGLHRRGSGGPEGVAGGVASEAQAFPLEYLHQVSQYLWVASDLWEAPLDGTDWGLLYQWSAHFFGQVWLWVKDYWAAPPIYL